ncbi:uncharacterized protein PHACADRAFT_264923 [Phanerochaete carnosa HHB-10118-sp]|uniref:Malate dehydrogenase n=1 Tax=Phanerochaete carnosa (strain HHB-10118-sp) TaxID=650164 RepID=K5VUS6_PHACS|nr:uncharacterized protein PHACADRAFT_264923 [Phanerochaete carnosa HHB-10118-sp]EKM50304.1 hypothetical protein PHACADRAFT_264923 [Phanerochaete carnosa HHB-10118-sp]
MQPLSKLLSAFALLGLALAALAVPSPAGPRTLQKRFGPLCDLSHDNISTVIPASINDGQARPLLPPIADSPTFVVLGVGYANYTCLPNGTWLSLGGLLELFDISCVPIDARATFTADVQQAWLGAPANLTAQDIVDTAGLADAPFALGQLYWVPDPLDPSDGTYNPVWDFGSTAWHDALAGFADHDAAYLTGFRTGLVPAPVDPAVNIEWVTLAPLEKDGKPLGTFADQVFRIFCNGGATTSDTCDPNGPDFLSKTALNFWYYGGYWATH